MNPPKCDDLDYIHFLIAAQKVFTCTEAERCQPEDPRAPAHDAFRRLLHKPPDTEALWQETEGLVKQGEGILVLDDTTLDKPYASKIELVTYHQSGKHHRVVKGINLLTLLWTDGKSLIPCDFRVYDKPVEPVSGKTKNEHFQDMLKEAKKRGFCPVYVLFDSWYASLENLKAVRATPWHWLTRLKNNRLVNPDGRENLPISEVEIPSEGREVHLRGYGFIKVFRIVSKDGDKEYWATDDLEMTEAKREELGKQDWGIESYHRGIKECCGAEKAQVRQADAQKGHILLSIRAFVRLEVHQLQTGQSWYDAKASIIRDAIRSYLAHPIYLLPSTA